MVVAHKLDIGVEEQNATIYSNHPLYQHTSDTPGLPLVYFQLIGPESYPVWSRAMYVSLMCKNKIGFINGSCIKENLDPSLHHVWDRCNAFLIAWIMNYVSRELLVSMIYSTSVYVV